MALEIEELIKIILGIFVVIAVVIGVYLFFKNKVLDFFNGISVGKNTTGIFWALIK